MLDPIYAGGAYRLTFTDIHGCRSHKDIGVPLSPQTYFPWFPKGCYTICNTQFPFALTGPPAFFNSWTWVGTPGSTGVGFVSPYTITQPGSVKLYLDNGLCGATTKRMDIGVKDCTECPIYWDNPTAACDPNNPHGYIITMVVYPTSNVHLELGFDNGPAVPFSVDLTASPTPVTLTYNYTTLGTAPPATQAEWFVRATGSGKECMRRKILPLPTCTWDPEKPGAAAADLSPFGAEATTATGLLVYPNPANSTVTAQYNYGIEANRTRAIILYDMLGREVLKQMATGVQNTTSLSTSNLPAGSYLLRMTEDGRAIQSQKLTIVH